ncbi:MAG: 2,3-bisphosphoglycerate-independent phosphoglycerate mutase [Firmicutes bacterium]|nr:2,3-bisphosphoglycerate-independent phosphoglycerate mutase [Bacillota bacterium]
MLSKVITIIFDGLGDRPVKELGNKTPLEAAATPNLDRLAANGICGLMHTMGRGIRPGSDVAHMSIFGYPMEKYYTGRGPIEVAGLGLRLQSGDIAFRGNFATVDDKWNITDRRAGRITDVTELAKALNGIKIDGIEFIVLAGTAHRAGVVMRGEGLSSAVSDSDPHEEGKPVYAVKPLNSSPEAHFTAAVLNKFLKQSNEVLSSHPANKKRVSNGKLPANFLLLRGAGVYPSLPAFKDKYGMSACCIAGGGLYKGIGAFLGMDIIDVPGATALPDSDVEAKFKTAVEMLVKYDFVFVHVKAADSLAEDGNYMGKKEFIEKCDKAANTLLKLPEDTLLVITADHTTPSALKAHSADPVPVLFCGAGIRTDRVAEFNETAVSSGGLGIIEGKDIMPEVLNLLGKLPLAGA